MPARVARTLASAESAGAYPMRNKSLQKHLFITFSTILFAFPTPFHPLPAAAAVDTLHALDALRARRLDTQRRRVLAPGESLFGGGRALALRECLHRHRRRHGAGTPVRRRDTARGAREAASSLGMWSGAETAHMVPGSEATVAANTTEDKQRAHPNVLRRRARRPAPAAELTVLETLVWKLCAVVHTLSTLVLDAPRVSEAANRPA
ncbi:hypothetical protein DFH11DRAFT_1730819 [Phellopilus nigrolimitatus]|nr:hypothetical protein DFH11DRAFT_1730819 [Phellopilus nigrolimitatus]